MTIKIEEALDEELDTLKQEKELHLRRAQAGQQKIRDLTTLAKENPEKYHVIAVDLQQALPTPKLTVGPAFYKRKLLTYNLGIHCCGSDQGYMMLWSEQDAKRGSDEICSCILKYLELAKPRSKELHIITDSCRGRNKNWTVVAMCAALVRGGRFDQVQQHFPVVGRTFLQCDRDFGQIKGYVRQHSPQAYSPKHWVHTIRSANTNTPFVVTLMSRDDFKSLKPCLDLIHKKTQTDDGRNLKLIKATSFTLRERQQPFQH